MDEKEITKLIKRTFVSSLFKLIPDKYLYNIIGLPEHDFDIDTFDCIFEQAVGQYFEL